MIKGIILTLILIAGTIIYACCMAASTSDEQSERIYREYLDYKRKKGEKDERTNL